MLITIHKQAFEKTRGLSFETKHLMLLTWCVFAPFDLVPLLEAFSSIRLQDPSCQWRSLVNPQSQILKPINEHIKNGFQFDLKNPKHKNIDMVTWGTQVVASRIWKFVKNFNYMTNYQIYFLIASLLSKLQKGLVLV